MKFSDSLVAGQPLNINLRKGELKGLSIQYLYCWRPVIWQVEVINGRGTMLAEATQSHMGKFTKLSLRTILNE